MLALPYLIKLNSAPRVIRDNFNRDSSACKSRLGYVIHSGVHRSTAFVSIPEAVASLEWSKALGQAGLNGWIEATIDGASLDDCERNALHLQFPGWTFKRVKSDKFPYVRATRGNERVGGIDWKDLAKRI